MMYIITGKYRGRRIESLESKVLRPTMGKVRESLFNILCHGSLLAPEYLNGTNVLDLFCGSGILGFEALSRGAASVTFVDKNREALNITRSNAEHLKVTADCRFVNADASMLPIAKQTYNVVFMDAPYWQNLSSGALKSLVKNGWLAPNALISVELPLKEDIVIPEGLILEDQREYGNTKLLFLRNNI